MLDARQDNRILELNLERRNTYNDSAQFRLKSAQWFHMIDSDQRPDSNRRPLLKSASTDVIISNHGPILGYSQIVVLSKLAYL